MIGLLAGIGSASADDFPTKPVRVLVPYAPGGAVDILARTLGESLSKTWKQQLVVENRPGAGGIVASQALVQSPPDGYTLILVASGHPLNQFFYPKLPYDTFKDFTAISELAYAPNVIVVADRHPARTLRDLIAMAREKPGALSYGMSGNGTSAHLAGELLKHMAGLDILAVPYKGGAPALTAVLGGEIPMSVNPLTEAIGQIRGGSVRALAVTTAQRSPVLPDVPTVAESGVAGYDTAVWWGLLAPAGMSAELAERLQRDFRKALDDPAVKDRLTALGAVPVASAPAEFDRFLHAEVAKWEPVIRAARISIQ